ncbi:MAG: CDP-alcohol phosphatidyltransferase family protein [bacterium]|nr:CDP-alcohol phosphatidyltransferase family protein [bacterium]
MIEIKYLANSITVVRIVGALLLLLFPPFSLLFYILYLLCGISDVLDGFVARKTNTQSKLGAMLDSIADIVFLLAALIKVFPKLLSVYPNWGIYIILLVAVVRGSSYLIGTIKFHRFAALHTILNKVTGVGIYCIPLLLMLSHFDVGLVIICLLAGISSIEELLCICKMDKFEADVRGIIELRH